MQLDEQGAKSHIKTVLLCTVETNLYVSWKEETEIIVCVRGPHLIWFFWKINLKYCPDVLFLYKKCQYLYIWYTHLGLSPETLWPQVVVFLKNFQSPGWTWGDRLRSWRQPESRLGTEGEALISHCGLQPELQVTDAEQGSAPEICKIIKKKMLNLTVCQC